MKLEKLEIQAYADLAFTQDLGSFALQINPESYKLSHATQYTKNDSTDTAGVTTKFYVQSPQTLAFDFYLDGTGAVQPAAPGVAAQIAQFKQIAYNYNGKIHSPNYLKIVWGGGIEFECRLTSLDIDHTLFKPDGTPLRAKLSVGFEQYLSPTEIARRANKSSPDLTHARVVRAGDTLPNLCYQIYGDSKYYWGVAEYNRLDQFRRLTPGATLYFPPLAA